MHGGKDDPAFWALGQHDLVGRLDVYSGLFAWTIAVRHYVRQLALSPDGRWFVVAGSLHWGGDKNDRMKRYPSRVELRSTADGSVADGLDLDSARPDGVFGGLHARRPHVDRRHGGRADPQVLRSRPETPGVTAARRGQDEATRRRR